MIVAIASTVFEKEESFDALDKLVDVFISGKHTWLIDDPEQIKKSLWTKTESTSRLGKKVDLLLKEGVKALYISSRQRESKNTIRISFDSKEAGTYTPQIGLKLLSEPLFILVENLNSDRKFVEAICQAFSRKELIEAIERGWIEFDSEGGINGTKRRIEFHFTKPFVPRLFVIVDSGRCFPGDAHKAGSVVEFCDKADVKYWVLHKREIENYIPEAALHGLPDTLSGVIEAYVGLNEDQKDFYDLKKGFNNKGNLPAEQENLFNGINSKDQLFKSLRNGFSEGGYNANHLHLCFDKKDRVTKAAMIKRCASNPDELPNLLNELSDLL